MNDCIFCKFVSKDIPTAMIYEDTDVYAFLDNQPLNIGHTLVIPKGNYANIYETPDEILAKMIIVAKKIAKKQKELLGAEGVNIHMNNDKSAGQSVFHSHMHVVPRYSNDGYKEWTRSIHTEEEILSAQDALKNSLL